MNPTIDRPVVDPDLRATIRLWLDDTVERFFRANPDATFVIDHDATEAAVPRWTRDGGAARIHCAWPNVLLPPRPLTALLRKLMVRAGASHDWAAIAHADVVERRRRMVERACAVLGVTRPATRGSFLLRVDDFPVAPGGLDAFCDFHAIAREHGVRYLLAVTPFAGGGLSERAAETLRQCVRDGAEIALHGFTHVGRSPAYANELLGMPAIALTDALDRADAHFLLHHLPKPMSFVAPFNGFDRSTFGVLAARFPLVCGGPESVAALGYRAGPSFLERALYMPSYRGAYDMPRTNFDGLDRLASASAELPVPVTIHWAHEASGRFAGFRRLCEHLRGRTGRWSAFADRARAVAFSTSS